MTDEQKPAEKQSDEQKPAEKQSDEQKPAEKQSDEQKPAEKQSAEQKPAARPAKKSDDKPREGYTFVEDRHGNNVEVLLGVDGENPVSPDNPPPGA